MRRRGGERAVRFQPENPAGVQADGKIKIAGALIGQAEQHARERQVEKSRHQRLDIRKTAQHARQQNQSGMPADVHR